jgi:HD-GYP domain-containing protein (c-di-GMP phosphodiesterase class II)
MTSATNAEVLLINLNRIGLALSSERNLDALLELILTEARRFTRAEAGTLYLREGEQLRFTVAQNDRLARQDEAGGSVLRNLTLPFDEKSIAGYAAVTGQVLNFEDAYAIPPDRPFRFNRDFDERNRYRSRSMLVVPMRDVAGSILGVVQLINALDGNGQVIPFDRALEPLVLSLASQAAVSVRNARLTAELRDAQYDTILRLSVAAEYRDADTAQHIHRVSGYAGALGRALGMTADEVELLVHASPMHDIGKLGIPDAVLQKPGKLTPEEFRAMQHHTTIGARILARAHSPILRMSEQIAMTHHEKWNGTGYPRGLKGRDIPLVGRIAAVADVFDALTSRRCYKPPFSLEKALGIVKDESGRQFDPDLVALFEKVLDEILAVRERFADPD